MEHWPSTDRKSGSSQAGELQAQALRKDGDAGDKGGQEEALCPH